MSAIRERLRQERRKVCFVGQHFYFGKQVEHDLDELYDVRWMELAPGTGGDWQELLEVEADVFVFFMPHQVPPEVRDALKGEIVAVHAEPLPKFIRGQYVSSPDLQTRLGELAPAVGAFRHLYHHDKTSLAVLEREGGQAKEFISAIATGSYYPRELAKRWDLVFIGRESSYRLFIMLPAKHVFGGRLLHVAHGIAGAELNWLLNSSVIGINTHTENLPALENRLQTYMACRLLVLSEPLSHNDFFKPGVHFVEFRGRHELIEKARYYLEHEEERQAIAQAGYDLVVSELAARVKWPKLIAEVLGIPFRADLVGVSSGSRVY